MRLERGISQERLAADAGVDRAYVSELERRQGNATLDLLDKLVAVLRIELSELFQKPDGREKKLHPLKTGRRKAARQG